MFTDCLYLSFIFIVDLWPVHAHVLTCIIYYDMRHNMEHIFFCFVHFHFSSMNIESIARASHDRKMVEVILNSIQHGWSNFQVHSTSLSILDGMSNQSYNQPIRWRHTICDLFISESLDRKLDCRISWESKWQKSCNFVQNCRSWSCRYIYCTDAEVHHLSLCCSMYCKTNRELTWGN